MQVMSAIEIVERLGNFEIASGRPRSTTTTFILCSPKIVTSERPVAKLYTWKRCWEWLRRRRRRGTGGEFHVMQVIRNLIGMECSMPRPQERLVGPLRFFFVFIAHWFFRLVIMFHNFLSFILFSVVVNHSESSVRSQSSSGCSRVRPS